MSARNPTLSRLSVASYRCRRGTRRSPLLCVGGRGTQSSLYRVTYVGKESTAPVSGHEEAGAELRKLRHQLETAHNNPASDIMPLIANLGHKDRFIRYAARVGLEFQPVNTWRQAVGPVGRYQSRRQCCHRASSSRVTRRSSADSRTTKHVAIGEPGDDDLLGALRAYQLAFTRLGEPSAAWREKLIARFDALYPDERYQVNAELVQLLVYLQSPTVVEKTLALMKQLGPEPIPDWSYLVTRNAGYGGTVGKMLADMPPSRGIHFAFVLRNVKSGWTLDQRKQYFQFLIDASKHTWREQLWQVPGAVP